MSSTPRTERFGWQGHARGNDPVRSGTGGHGVATVDRVARRRQNSLNVIRGDGKSFAGKVTLGRTTTVRPALLSRSGKLVLAWQGVGSNQLNTIVSTNGGATWGGWITSPQTSTDGPAFAANGPANVIVWTGTNAGHNLNMAIVSP